MGHSESWRPPPTRILSRHLHRHHHPLNPDTKSRHKTPKQPPCLRRRPPARLPARAPTSPPAARERRTPTCRSAVCPPTCSSPTTSVTRFARRTLVSSSARSARSLVRSGRASTTSRGLPTRPRLPLTRSVTRRRRQPTLLVARTRTKRSRRSPSGLLSLHVSNVFLALFSCASRSTVSCIFTRAGRGKGFHGTDGVESCGLNDSCVSLVGNDTKG